MKKNNNSKKVTTTTSDLVPKKIVINIQLSIRQLLSSCSFDFYFQFCFIFCLFFFFFSSLLLYSLLGGTGSGSLFVISATLQPQWTRILGHMHTDRHARDQGVCGAGCHQCFYHHPLHGHENSAHWQKVSRTSFAKKKKRFYYYFLFVIWRSLPLSSWSPTSIPPSVTRMRPLLDIGLRVPKSQW